MTGPSLTASLRRTMTAPKSYRRSGSRDNLPQLPDGKYMPAMRLNCGEQLLRKGAERQAATEYQCAWRRSQAAPPAHARPLQVPLLRQLRRRLRRGRDVQLCCLDSARSSGYGPNDAQAQLVVRHIIVDPTTGKAQGVAFVDRVTRQSMKLRARSWCLQHQRLSRRA